MLFGSSQRKFLFIYHTFSSHEQCSVLREGIIYVITMPFTLCSVLPMMLGHFVKADTTFILPSDLQPSTYYGAIEKYKVCQDNNCISIIVQEFI